MSIAIPHNTKNDQRTLTLCIDSYENKVLTGRIWQGGSGSELTFNSCMSMITSLENLFNEQEMPQPERVMRSFVSRRSECSDSWKTRGTNVGQLATFQITVLFRRNSSWQGSVTWLESEKQIAFRSVLELLLLIDGALCSVNLECHV